jgi:hypothetical protein
MCSWRFLYGIRPELRQLVFRWWSRRCQVNVGSCGLGLWRTDAAMPPCIDDTITPPHVKNASHSTEHDASRARENKGGE